MPHPKTWIANKNKLARNCGQEYVTYSKTFKIMITVPARKIGPDCGCLQKCMIKLNEIDIAIILTLFKNYWALGDYDLQTAYLVKQSVEK